MIGSMASHRLPPKAKLLVRLTTAALGLLVIITGARMAPLVIRHDAATEPLSLEKGAPVNKAIAGLMGALPLSAPPPAPPKPAQAEKAPPPPPPLNVEGLSLKGVFVNMLDNRKSMVIVSQKGGVDLILKRGDMARQGVMLDEIYPDKVFFKGISGDKKSLRLTDFIKEAVIMGDYQQSMTGSISDMEDPMGPPIYDPTSPGPGMAGDVAGYGGMDSGGPVRYMPIPSLPATPQGGSMAAPLAGSSGIEGAISKQMNAVRNPAEQGKQ